MSETVAMLQKQIAGYVLMPTDPEVLETALAGMRRATDLLNMRMWKSALTYDDISFVPEQTDYALASWFKAPRNFEIWDTDGNAVFRMKYKEWKTFLMEHSNFTIQGDPCVYSCANLTDRTISLNASPRAEWVTLYPGGRLWYFRKFGYPTTPGPLDCPSQMTAYVQAFAEGYTADRHAPQKAAMAYNRASAMYEPPSRGALVVDDNELQTDWE